MACCAAAAAAPRHRLQAVAAHRALSLALSIPSLRSR